jgi:hypothetical protein
MTKFRVAALAAAVLLPAIFTVEARAQAIPAGHYVCFHFTTPLPLLNFTIKGGGRYVDAGGRTGSYSFSGGKITFHGGNFDGQHAAFRSRGTPTIAFMSARGAETEVCQPGQH